MTRKKVLLALLGALLLVCLGAEVLFRVSMPNLGPNLFEQVSQPGTATKQLDDCTVMLAHNVGSNWHTWSTDLRDHNDQRIFRFVAATNGNLPGIHLVDNDPRHVVTYQPVYLDINQVAWSDLATAPLTGYWEHHAGQTPRPIYRNFLGLLARNPIPLNL